ncbi:MAG: GNAT family N-acetyltransferase [Chryseobacterium sp.]|nr:GNAT family N-acetyltransferase [Chryseobacterium sp.]
MIFREAKIDDIRQMQIVRNSVKENQLSDPDVVKDKDYEIYLTDNGKGWVCEIDNEIVGFAIVDLVGNNIWALFLNPEFENQGIGKQLHNIMLDWYFQQTENPVWLGTSPNTRAEKFYRSSGWEEIGTHGKEIKFQMTWKQWENL